MAKYFPETSPNIFGFCHRRCSIKKAVFQGFAIFTVKHLCWSLFLMKVQALWAERIETPTQVFSCEYCEVSRNTYFEERLRTAPFGFFWKENCFIKGCSITIRSNNSLLVFLWMHKKVLDGTLLYREKEMHLFYHLN